MSRTVFKVFSSCFLVAGANRALVIDSQRWKYYSIPNSMYNLIKEFDGFSIDYVKEKVCKTLEDIQIIDEYFDFLFTNEIIFNCTVEVANQFIGISEDFLHPSKITNAILEFDSSDFADLFKRILTQLVRLGCFSIEVRITKIITLQKLETVANLCLDLEVNNLSLVVQIEEEIEYLLNIKNTFPFIVQIINHSQQNENKIQAKEGIIYTSENLANHNSCGIVKSKYFTPTLSHYTESLAHNTCLNRKIAIDTEGNIKNCPSMKESFGNIRDTTLEEAINKPGFKKYWNIKKDEITKCKDCEFRHVCTDCRAYIDNPEDIYSAPLKCGYDPYTCEWEEWSTNPLKQKAIDFYGMREIF